MTTRAPSPLHPEQQAARDVVGVSVALSAGAGCGKTRVLMERYLGALGGAQPEPLGRLVALTFTEKAALELRDRVRGDCHRRLADPTASGADATTDWRGVLRGLDAAPIGTFHSFCARILQRFPIEAGLEPGFGVIDATVAATVRDEAIAALVRQRLLKQDPDLIRLAIDVGLARVQDLLGDLVNARTQADLAAWAARDVDAIIEAWEDHWHRDALPHYRENNRTLALEWLRSLELCRYVGKGVVGERLQALGDTLLSMDWDGDFVSILKDNRPLFSLSGSQAKSWSDPDAYATMKAVFERLRAAADEALKLGSYDEMATRAAAETGRRLARIGVLAIDAYDRAKRARGQIDFDDQLLRTRALLRAKPEPVARWLDRSVGFVLVDEFQDTDPIQAEILRLLTGDRFAASLYLVGDIKQSIYRFRGAQPELFTRLREEFPDAGRKTLRANFRSRPAVLDFVNALFSPVFPGDEHRLLSGLDLPPATADPAVTLVWPFEAGESESKPNAPQLRKVEARWLARLLAGGLADGRWRIRDRQTGQERPAVPGDIAILFRTLNDAAAYEDALVSAGLEYYVVGGAAFFGQQEVLDVINVLSVIENPLDALALAATLRGPFGGLSDNALYWLGTLPHGDLPTAFDRVSQLGALDPTDRERATRLRGLLEHWRSLKDAMPIATLLDRVLIESGVEAALPADFLGDRRRANLRKLVRMARVYDAETSFTLGSFIHRLRADWRTPPREEQAATTDEHESRAVRLMTIHQAKGLEFPIVVVPDLNRKDQAGQDPMAVSDDLGIVVTPSLALGEESSDETENRDARSDTASTSSRNLGWMLHRHRERIASEDEARRMFYVATTRARDVLILSAGMAPDEKPGSPALRLLAECFDLNTGACLVGLPDGARVPTLAVIQTQPPEPPAFRRAPRPQLLRVAREIDRLSTAPLAVSAASATPVRPALPAWLDVHPGTGLGPRTARDDALLRAVLAEPADLLAAPDRLAAALHAQARQLVPAIPSSTERNVRAALAAWLTTPLGRSLRSAHAIRSAITWTRPMASDVREPGVLAGALDLLVLDPRGRATLIHLALPGADPLRERVRLIGSARAALDRGVATPVGRGGLVRLDAEDTPALQGEDHFDESALRQAIDDYLVSIPRA